jgi:hypothetical protein
LLKSFELLAEQPFDRMSMRFDLLVEAAIRCDQAAGFLAKAAAMVPEGPPPKAVPHPPAGPPPGWPAASDLVEGGLVERCPEPKARPIGKRAQLPRYIGGRAHPPEGPPPGWPAAKARPSAAGPSSGGPAAEGEWHDYDGAASKEYDSDYDASGKEHNYDASGKAYHYYDASGKEYDASGKEYDYDAAGKENGYDYSGKEYDASGEEYDYVYDASGKEYDYDAAGKEYDYDYPGKEYDASGKEYDYGATGKSTGMHKGNKKAKSTGKWNAKLKAPPLRTVNKTSTGSKKGKGARP